jgi:hypothetical protein
MRFRLVDSADRAGYRDAVAAAGILAGEVGAHFWAFEVDGEAGRFVEFLEGPEDVALTRLDEMTSASLTAQGSLAGVGWPGPDGLRSTELRDSTA